MNSHSAFDFSTHMPYVSEASGTSSARWWRFDCLPCIPARYVLAVVSCLGFVNVYALRVNLSVAIVQMANSTATARNGSAKVS